jgi:hypothetical protein
MNPRRKQWRHDLGEPDDIRRQVMLIHGLILRNNRRLGSGIKERRP